MTKRTDKEDCFTDDELTVMLSASLAAVMTISRDFDLPESSPLITAAKKLCTLRGADFDELMTKEPDEGWDDDGWDDDGWDGKLDS
tara:strand:+ start:1453 stop:1710 length:258 start_codon:yes stop_codon:yes gene_type:complete